MARDLHNTVREGLQAKQVSTEAANCYLKDLKSIPRYNSAVKLCRAFCSLKNISATSATLTEVASLLLQFEKLMPTHGRHAYAALLLVPGLEQLQFNPLLKKGNGIPPRHGMCLFTMPRIPLQGLLLPHLIGGLLNICACDYCCAAGFSCFAGPLIWNACSEKFLLWVISLLC